MPNVFTKRCWSHGPYDGRRTCPSCVAPGIGDAFAANAGERRADGGAGERASPGLVIELRKLEERMREHGCGCGPMYCSCEMIRAELDAAADEISELLRKHGA